MSPYIVAEIASAHYGNVAVLHDLIFAAFDAGCDGIKLQVWRGHEIKQHKAYHNLKKFELTAEQWQQAARTIKSLKMDLWLEFYGRASFELATALDYDYGKASRQLLNADKPFLQAYTNYISETKEKRDAVFWRWNKSLLRIPRKIALGRQDYPTSIEAGQKDIEFIKTILSGDIEIVYACHQHALIDDAYTVPLAAYQAGANYIEKHICIDRAILKQHSDDWISAFEPDEFERFVHFMKDDKKVKYIR